MIVVPKAVFSISCFQTVLSNASSAPANNGGNTTLAIGDSPYPVSESALLNMYASTYAFSHTVVSSLT
jgi:hypothetical protein